MSQIGDRKTHIRVEGELHRLLRTRCVELDLTIQDDVVRLLEENLRGGSPTSTARNGKDHRGKATT